MATPPVSLPDTVTPLATLTVAPELPTRRSTLLLSLPMPASRFAATSKPLCPFNSMRPSVVLMPATAATVPTVTVPEPVWKTKSPVPVKPPETKLAAFPSAKSTPLTALAMS